MRIHRSIGAHPRLSPAHGPEPLTAPGAAQACPTCLPSPSHQLTLKGDLRPGCPLQKSARFAPRHSAIGNITDDRPAENRFSTPAMSVLMSGLCSGRQGLRPLAPPFLTEAAHQHNFSDSLGCARPIVPSLPLRPGTRLRAERFGAVTCCRPAFPGLPLPVPASHPLICGDRDVWPRLRPLALAASANPTNQLTWDSDLRHDRPLMKGVRFAPGHSSIGGFIQSEKRTLPLSPWKSLNLTAVLPFAFNPVNTSRHPASPDLINPIRRLEVTQDSDFRWKSRIRKKLGFSSVPPGVRRPSERLAAAHQVPSVKIKYLTSLTKMAYQKKPGIKQFHVDCTTEAHSRFQALHQAFALPSKAATFEAILFAVSIKDKIDPQILTGMDSKLDRVLERLNDSL